MNARADRFFLLDSLGGVAALLALAVHDSWFSRYYLVGRPALSLKRLMPRQPREDRPEALAASAPAALATAPPA